MTSGIYLLTFEKSNSRDNRYYIGKSKDIERRYKEHCTALKNDTHYAKLQEAYTGVLPSIKVISVCHEDFATVLENYFINKYGHIHGYKRILNTNYTELDRKTSYRGVKLLRTLDINKSLISNFEGLVPANYKKGRGFKLAIIPIESPESLYDL